MSQRDLARELGVSLGKTNYLLKALVQKGFVKAQNFAGNPDKLHYRYLLTAHGIEEKARVTTAFFKRKMKEYDEIKKVIESLKQEVENTAGVN